MYYWSSHSKETTTQPVQRGIGKSLFFLLICFAWLFPGLVGHEPWKPDEAYTFGLVNHIFKNGDWIVPTLAGEPFMEKPPLFYITAAAFAKVFSNWLPLHDAARLTSGFFMGLALFFTGMSGRELYGRGKGLLSVLALISCLGLLIRAHELITDLALLAGIAMALYGLALSLRRHIIGGILLGTGTGISFMSKGLIGPGMIGITVLLLPILFQPWRNRFYLQTLIIAFAAALPWLVIWPLALYQRSPALFMEWFWTNNLGRFLGFAGLGPKSETAGYLKMLPWFAWPALPLAIWTLWQEKRNLFKRPELHLPLTAFLVMFGVLSSASDAREVYAIPMLLPLACLAAASIDTLRRGATNALYWFGVMVFTFFGCVIWFYWIAVELGIPAGLSAHLKDLQPGYTPVFSWFVFSVGLIYTAGWLATLVRTKRSKERPIIIWATGMTLVWGLLMSLFISWLDAGKSYRSTIYSLTQAIPAHIGCIASQGLGEPQRAMLDYYANIITQRAELGKGAECDLMLTQGGVDNTVSLSPDWQQIWEGNRPGDKSERYRLFQRPASVK
ncbi:ArnT family glycosyltransferase [Sulfurirhabdus autotrophica]|uniref:4-amino-4-deoxy-L-arabinose transferase-like glycosyltransferase n=1 Tax=Sulfurirhabdus autotrophica TaxID=1706046 RepID=A0A4R3XUL1_9PROT|nr:glycosyltransferase family 39 protein [Sulfurirhabdus autotrophica]TCV82926.1 4-amino-4-deoxy-L-arabinose transferase-like glycosyltransferase [Sulfurirhabdus autotrophica]